MVDWLCDMSLYYEQLYSGYLIRIESEFLLQCVSATLRCYLRQGYQASKLLRSHLYQLLQRRQAHLRQGEQTLRTRGEPRTVMQLRFRT